jgi:hypothetical protein
LIGQVSANRYRSSQVCSGVLCGTLRHLLCCNTLLAESCEHFGDRFVLDRNRKRVARPDVIWETTDVQLFERPVEHSADDLQFTLRHM